MRRGAPLLVFLAITLVFSIGCTPTVEEQLQLHLGKTGRILLESQVEDEQPLQSWVDDVTLLRLEQVEGTSSVWVRMEQFSRDAEGELDPVELPIRIEDLVELQIGEEVVYVRPQ